MDRRPRPPRRQGRTPRPRPSTPSGPSPETVVAGRIPVLECLRAGRRIPRHLYFLEDAKGLEPILAPANLPRTACSRDQLDTLAHGVLHQGVVLVAEPLRTWGVRDWLRDRAGATTLVVALDGIEDPQNFGAIVRSVAAFGAGAVLFAKDRAAPISPASVKAAAGAMEHLDLIQETNLARAIEHMKEANFWSYGLDADGSSDLWSVDLHGRVLLVVGNEGSGIRRLVLERCDYTVRIPIEGPISSLNASVSAAVALAEWARQGARRRKE